MHRRADRATTGLPPDLLNRAAYRLQILCWLYAFTFFMAAFFPVVLSTTMCGSAIHTKSCTSSA